MNRKSWDKKTWFSGSYEYFFIHSSSSDSKRNI